MHFESAYCQQFADVAPDEAICPGDEFGSSVIYPPKNTRTDQRCRPALRRATCRHLSTVHVNRAPRDCNSVTTGPHSAKIESSSSQELQEPWILSGRGKLRRARSSSKMPILSSCAKSRFSAMTWRQCCPITKNHRIVAKNRDDGRDTEDQASATKDGATRRTPHDGARRRRLDAHAVDRVHYQVHR